MAARLSPLPEALAVFDVFATGNLGRIPQTPFFASGKCTNPAVMKTVKLIWQAKGSSTQTGNQRALRNLEGATMIDFDALFRARRHTPGQSQQPSATIHRNQQLTIQSYLHEITVSSHRVSICCSSRSSFVGIGSRALRDLSPDGQQLLRLSLSRSTGARTHSHPDGYTPYHIEHYGRHGSRWHIGTGSYRRPVEMLAKADAAGKLTPRGKELLGQLRDIEVASRGRDGELTDVGAEQHRGIARRMISNFPEVFEGPARVDARSTVVIRCILSMDNELQELKAANPALIVTSDASRADMPYMNFSDTDTVAQQAARKADSLLKDFGKTHRYMDDFLPNIVTDTQWAKDSLDTGALFYYLFNIAANAQSHKDMPAPYDIFSDREMRERWEYNNAAWFTTYGNMEVSEGLASYNQRRLLDNMLSSADSTLTSTYPSANLRFGHEVVVMPLVVFMELDNYGKEINDLNQVASQWRDWEIFLWHAMCRWCFTAPPIPAPASLCS